MVDSVAGKLETEKPPTLPAHLSALPGGRWAVWRWVGLRGAGFPAERIFQLAAQDCARGADEIIQTQDELARAKTQTLDVLRQTLKGSDTVERRRLNRAIRQVLNHQPPEVPEAADPARQAVERFCAVLAQTEAGWRAFEQQFLASVSQISDTLYETLQDDRFREAVTWQNRQAFARVNHALHRDPSGRLPRNNQSRKNEELVASYLQRYCVKNDTIGFFGPGGWANFVSDGAALRARPGAHFLAKRTVYFEGWCIDTLAETLAKDKALRPWLAPRRLPFIHLAGTTLYLPAKPPMKISPEQAALLQACEGDQTAKDIALRLLQKSSLKLRSEDEVYRLLDYLTTSGLTSWTLEIPLEANPERTLRRHLERIEDVHLRQTNLNALDAFEHARAAIAQAAGDAEKLNHALAGMEATFTQLTGAPATRAAGKTYAARTLVYEDCQRDLEFKIGPQVLETLGPPLSLLLESARWFTFETAALYRQILGKFYRELAWKAGSATIPLVECWRQLQPVLFTERTPPLEQVLPRFQERWACILAIPPDERRVQYQTEALRSRVCAEFAAPRPGWKFARYHSPDVMIAASSLEAICRDEYQWVMGELHIGTNTLRSGGFMDQHPAPDEVFQALDRDLPEPRLVPILPKSWPELTSSTRPVFVLPKDLQLAFTHDTYAPPGVKTLPIGALLVEEQAGNLIVRTREGRQSFDAIEVLAEAITQQVVNCFRILRPARHTPRINFDRLVVCREAWHLPADELTFAFENSEAERFIAYRRWARVQDIPRFTFVKTPLERKPFYVDSDSPVLINLLARAVRRVVDVKPADACVTVTEMLPGPHQVWLPDAAGQAYTCELRIIAIDLPE